MANRYHLIVFQILIFSVSLLIPAGLLYAQSEPESEAELVSLPTQAVFTLTVASAGTRDSALLTLIALKRLQENFLQAKVSQNTASIEAILDSGSTAVAAEETTQSENPNTVDSNPQAPDYSDLLRQFADDRAWIESLRPVSLELAIEPLDLFNNGFLTQKFLLELGQHSLFLETENGSTDQALEALLIKLLFEHKQRAIVRALLPYVLRKTEAQAVKYWQSLQQTMSEQEFATLISSLDPQVFEKLDADFAPETDNPVPASSKQRDKYLQKTFAELLENLLLSVEILTEENKQTANQLADNSLPDQDSNTAETVSVAEVSRQEFTEKLRNLRRGLLDVSLDYDVTLALYTLDVLAALRNQHGLVFSKGLNYLTTALMNQIDSTVVIEEATRAQAPASDSVVEPEVLEIYPVFENGWLPLVAENLEQLQKEYGPKLAQVDPANKTALALTAEVFAQLFEQDIQLEEQRRKLVDARAMLELLLPDASYYFQQPLRESYREEISFCTSIVAAALVGDQPISPEQFEGCISTFLNIGTLESKNTPLSGNSTGPWEQEQLRRELSLTPWQRVNYLLAYLSKQYSNACNGTTRVFNPLEWSMQATVMAWFASPWPSLAGTEINENSIDKMLTEMTHFIQQMTVYEDCLLGDGGDLLQRMQASYNLKLDELISSVNTLEIQFREDKLSPGADIQLDGGAEQKTNYRPESLEILPCDIENICDMSAPLPATLALVGLFPSPYLVADQSRMGQIEVCYDKVRWVDRRLTQARENAPDVANYYAHLGFSIKGRFHQNDKVTDVFERSFVSPEEYHYLFAANDPSVLEAECPMSIVGQPIITKLHGSKLKIVPDRLTYLTAARTLPSRLFTENWEKGAEWRDWFVTGRGVEEVTQLDGSELLDPVNIYLHSLRESRETMLYSALLSPPLSSQSADSLAQRVSAISVEKALLKSTLAIFHGDLLQNNEWVREAVTGSNGLVDRRVLRRLREAGIPVREIAALARSRSQRFSEFWQRLAAHDSADSSNDEAAISSMFAVAWLQLKHLQQQQMEQTPMPSTEAVLTPLQPSAAAPVLSAEPSN